MSDNPYGDAFTQMVKLPSEVEQNKSAAALNTQQAKKLEYDNTEAALDQAYSQLDRVAMSGQGSQPTVPDSTGDSRADILERKGLWLSSMGASGRGLDYLKSANDLRKQEEEAANGTVNREQTRLENQQKQADLMYQAMVGANAENWNQTLDTLKANPAYADPNAQRLLEQFQQQHPTWEPSVAKHYRDQAFTAYQSAQLETTANSQRITEDHNKNIERISQTNADIAQQNLNERRRETDLRTKEGKTATAPTSDDLKAAETSIRNNVKVSGFNLDALDAVEGNAARPNKEAAVSYIAGRTKEILLANPGIMSYQEASNQAVIQTMAEGSFQPVAPVDVPWYMPGSNKPASVKITPSKKQPVGVAIPNDPKKWDKTVIYNYNGVSVRFNGKDFVEVKPQ